MSSAAMEFWAFSGLAIVLVVVVLFAFVFGPQAIREWQAVFTEDPDGDVVTPFPSKGRIR